jgi:hypothetical protein
VRPLALAVHLSVFCSGLGNTKAMRFSQEVACWHDAKSLVFVWSLAFDLWVAYTRLLDCLFEFFIALHS